MSRNTSTRDDTCPRTPVRHTRVVFTANANRLAPRIPRPTPGPGFLMTDTTEHGGSGGARPEPPKAPSKGRINLRVIGVRPSPEDPVRRVLFPTAIAGGVNDTLVPVPSSELEREAAEHLYHLRVTNQGI